MKHWPYLALTLLALSLGWLTGSWMQNRSPATEPAPPFSLIDMNGTEHRLTDYAGRLVLINFWATWCAPCLKEIPLLNDTYRQHAAQGLSILGPAIDDSSEISRMSADLAISYPVIPGGTDLFTLMDAFGDHLGALPFSVLISPEGLIVERHWGALTEDLLATWLQSWLPATANNRS